MMRSELNRRRVHLLFVAVSVVGLAACQLSPTAGPLATVEPGLVIAGDDDTALLHELVARILEPRSAHFDPALANPPVLHVGELSPNLPLALPVPEGSKVIGSFSEPATMGGTQVFLDVPLPAQAVINFYVEALVEQGYAVWQPGGQPVFSGYDGAVMLCQAEQGIQANVTAVERDTGLADVRVGLITDARAVSCDDEFPNGQHEAMARLLPRLVAPQGVVVRGGGSGYSIEGRAHVSAELLTALSLAELAEHYAAGLVQHGWQLVMESETGPVAWSDWARQDDQDQRWIALLIVTAGPGASQRRYAEFRMELALE